MKLPQKLLMNRRQIILAGTMAAFAPAPQRLAGRTRADRRIELWPGGAPGGGQVTVQRRNRRAACRTARCATASPSTSPGPLLTLFEPKAAYNGITLLIVPGGGYVRVVIDKEGFEAAEWFTQRGFAAAVLRYRLPADGWAAGADAPVHDAMRARAPAAQPADAGDASVAARVGVIGFSAGGHLCARLITEPELAYPRRDAADDLSARPDFAVLMYPVIATTGAHAHAGSAQQLLAAGVAAAELARYSPHLNVGAQTPPTLLVHAADDTSVPVENSLLMYDALRKAGVRSELHVFDSGGHGFGLRGVAGKDVAAWPTLVRELGADTMPRPERRRSAGAAACSGAASLGMLAVTPLARARRQRGTGRSDHRRPRARNPSTATCRYFAAFATAPTPPRADSCRPQRPQPWRGVVDARRRSARRARSRVRKPNQSEDCLFLNVTAPLAQGRAAASGHRLHPRRRVLERLGIEPAVRRLRRCAGAATWSS